MTAAAPRFVIGIDLGTTNSAVAYADLREVASALVPRVRVFDVPQVVAEGEVSARPTLPSFLYLVSEPELRARGLAVPWPSLAAGVVGTWARDEGALVPTRLVSSAKSWLCNTLVDRRASLLPWGSDEGAPTCSPVEACAAYVAHVRDAWNHAMAHGDGAEARRFEHQAIVLTVPASFDEEARELTVEAARLAQLSLIEEPTAALYAWMAAHAGRLSQELRDGDLLLVCDVGGGTADFTLVTVTVDAGGEPTFDRTAVGHHLLLGGDNLDLALADLVTRRLGHPSLTVRQQQALRRQCASAKERLLGPPPAERIPLTLLGGGSSVVGGARTIEITRDEVLSLLLDGFLPRCGLDAVPAGERRHGLRELGLPYATDAAITRHLAAFLREAGHDGRPARPTAVLFNGGFFTPEESRARVADVLGEWFGEVPRVLANASPATAVAEGAAYFGLAARWVGPRIGGGSPRSFYVALGGEATAEGTRAVCVVPRGAEQGTGWRLERQFTVAANRPLSFTLWSSLTRRDAVGDIVALPEDGSHRHAPLVTELRFGKRSRQRDIRVDLDVRYTELGTLELWLRAPDTGHRWRLQFQLRGAIQGDRGDGETAPTAAIEAEALDAAAAAIRATFPGDPAAAAASPEGLMAQLEAVLGLGKQAWPVATVRPLSDLLLECADGRRRSPAHEARWLNLLGYCLRPGFGATLDEWRMTQARRVYLEGQVFAANVQGQVEWLLLWQRLAGGLSPGQQQELFARYAAVAGIGGKRGKWLPPEVQRETLRLLASLEQVPVQKRVALGEELLARLHKQRRSASLLWSLGRAGARVPLHGPLNAVVPAARVQAWIATLLDTVPVSEELAAAVVRMAERTGDPARDLDEAFCRDLHVRLRNHDLPAGLLAALLEAQAPSDRASALAYGESLPEGLRLLPVPHDAPR